VVLQRHCDVALHDSDTVLALAYTNSHFQIECCTDRARAQPDMNFVRCRDARVEVNPASRSRQSSISDHTE
jgi:hypothetical protein